MNEETRAPESAIFYTQKGSYNLLDLLSLLLEEYELVSSISSMYLLDEVLEDLDVDVDSEYEDSSCLYPPAVLRAILDLPLTRSLISKAS